MNEISQAEERLATKTATSRRKRASSVGQRPGQQHRQNGSGNAKANYERYMALAREAALAGDPVEMENCYQHAEHYFRVMRERST